MVAEDRHRAPSVSPLSILALGDSYTIGEGVLPAERWPVQLAASLRARGWPAAEPHMIARTGWTTDELARGIAVAELTPPYQLVTLLIGVNNQYRGRPLLEYQAQFEALLGRAIALAGDQPARVLVLSIPDWGVTPFGLASGRPGISAEIDAFNAAKRASVLRSGAIFVDITPLSRRAASEPNLLAPDQLHPSGKMYAGWVQLILSNSSLLDELAALTGSQK